MSTIKGSIAIMLLSIALQLTGSLAHASERTNQRFTVVVTDAFINLRTGAGKAYPIFYVAQRGESLSIAKRRTSWFKVELESNGGSVKTGWVHEDDLSMANVAGTDLPASSHPQIRRSINPSWSGNYQLGRLSEDDLVGLGVSYNRLKALSFELRGLAFTGSVFQGWVINGQLKFSPFSRWVLAPYLSSGYGFMKREVRGDFLPVEDNSDHVFIVGAGLDVRLHQDYRLSFDYQQFNILPSSSENIQLDAWQLGLSVNF